MKVILVDDEPIALNYLEHKLSTIGGIEIIGKYIDPIKSIERIKDIDVDVIFLDIQMPGINGIELAEQLLEENPSLNIVFVTAYQEYAIKAFELNALDYMLKPISRSRLLNTINRISNHIELQKLKDHKESQGLKLNLFKNVTLKNQKNKNINLKWRTSKAEQLFLYFLHHRETIIDKTSLIELFWEDMDFEKALQQLYITIYHIRKALKDFQEYFTIKNTQNGYMLNINKVEIDVEVFEDIIKKYKIIDKSHISEYERAISLVRGEYLEDYDFLKCEIERQKYSILWIEGSFKLVEWYYKTNDFKKALPLLIRIKDLYPYEEKAYLYLMKIYERQANQQKVHIFYTELKEVLKEELNQKPSKEITDWYNKWNKSLRG